jgi:hypothetical protein
MTPWRRISITSLKPLVVTIAARGNSRVIRAFVATAVPWENRLISPSATSISPMPSKTASIGSLVDETFATRVAPS